MPGFGGASPSCDPVENVCLVPSELVRNVQDGGVRRRIAYGIARSLHHPGPPFLRPPNAFVEQLRLADAGLASEDDRDRPRRCRLEEFLQKPELVATPYEEGGPPISGYSSWRWYGSHEDWRLTWVFPRMKRAAHALRMSYVTPR
jgi:hypothetical protein